MLRGGIIFLPLHSASEEGGTPEELTTNGEKKVSFFSFGMENFFYLCTPLRRKGFRFEGRGKERDVDGEMANKKKYFIFICGRGKVSYLCSPKRNGS